MKMMTETCAWPLFEVDHGVWRLTYKPKEKQPVTEWLKMQGRFRHLFRPENAPIIEAIQKDVDTKWERLLKLCGETT
jgi:pyruvate ferredoxin oxidoreductase beta subunit